MDKPKFNHNPVTLQPGNLTNHHYLIRFIYATCRDFLYFLCFVFGAIWPQRRLPE